MLKYIIHDSLKIQGAEWTLTPNPPTNLELAEFGFRFDPEDVEVHQNGSFRFWMQHCSRYKKKSRYEKWYDKYLTTFFDYRYITNHFLYLDPKRNLRSIPDLLYYEVHLLCSLQEDPSRCISIGYSTYSTFLESVGVTFLLGWMEKGIGYHSDDGYIFCDGNPKNKLEPLQQAGTVGCGYHLASGAIFYTMNGILKASFSYPTRMPLYPSIILDQVSLQDVKINVGEEPFLYDLGKGVDTVAVFLGR